MVTHRRRLRCTTLFVLCFLACPLLESLEYRINHCRVPPAIENRIDKRRVVDQFVVNGKWKALCKCPIEPQVKLVNACIERQRIYVCNQAIGEEYTNPRFL